jgi:hypothetical protein
MPSVFVEVKGVGRSVEGDRQLFEYAFHEGVPLCLLTDGRDWSFYLPSGQGSYEDRRVYKLRLDERSPSDCVQVLRRYLQFDRVKSGQALDDASKDYRDIASKREASRHLPTAWCELVSERDDLLIDILLERAEKLSGFRPERQQVFDFLYSLSVSSVQLPGGGGRKPVTTQAGEFVVKASEKAEAKSPSLLSGGGRQVTYRIFGDELSAANGSQALIEILRALCSRFPDHISEIAQAVQGSSRNHIARTVEEIYPARPDLARAAEIAPGWLVGLNIANREKAAIVQAACEVLNLTYGIDVVADFPNANS